VNVVVQTDVVDNQRRKCCYRSYNMYNERCLILSDDPCSHTSCLPEADDVTQLVIL